MQNLIQFVYFINKTNYFFKNEDNSSENVVIKSRNIEDAKKTLTLNSKSGTQESNLDFSMKIGKISIY